MADDWDPVFKALADRHRRAILAALYQGPRPASDLARLAGLAMNAVSFHLRWLKSAGLVSVERKGRWRWYRVEAGFVAAWLAATRDVFGAAGEAVAKRKPRARPRRLADVGPSQVRGENVATDTLPDELL
jgi:DNA-binding transcriptional ArsR family regulator